MTKTKNTSMRLLLSCGSEDIYCSASESSLDSSPSKEFQERPPLDIVNEALRAGKSTKRNETNGKTHQLQSSKECKREEYALEEEGTDVIAQVPATKREEAKVTKQMNTSMRLLLSCGSEDICSSTESSLNIPSTEFQRPPLDIINEALRASKRTLTLHQLDSFKGDKESDCALEGKETTIITHDEPGTKRAPNDANATRPALLEPLSRLTSSRRVLRPSLQRMWVSVTNIQVEGRPTIKESREQHREEGDEGGRGEEECETGGEEPESKNRFFQFSQMKTRSLRAASRLQLQTPWSSSRYLKIEDTQHPTESQTSDEDACPRLLTSSRVHESTVEETNPKPNWPTSIGVRRDTAVPSLVQASLDKNDDGVDDDNVSKELAEETRIESHNEPSSQPTTIPRSRGNRPKLQRRGSVTKFNLDHATNESFRRRRPRMERRCSVTQFSLGVKEAQAQSMNTNCVFVAPKMSRPKLSRSGQATVLIFSNETFDLSNTNDEPKRNVIAPNAA